MAVDTQFTKTRQFTKNKRYCVHLFQFHKFYVSRILCSSCWRFFRVEELECRFVWYWLIQLRPHYWWGHGIFWKNFETNIYIFKKSNILRPWLSIFMLVFNARLKELLLIEAPGLKQFQSFSRLFQKKTVAENLFIYIFIIYLFKNDSLRSITAGMRSPIITKEWGSVRSVRNFFVWWIANSTPMSVFRKTPKVSAVGISWKFPWNQGLNFRAFVYISNNHFQMFLYILKKFYFFKGVSFEPCLKKIGFDIKPKYNGPSIFIKFGLRDGDGCDETITDTVDIWNPRIDKFEIRHATRRRCAVIRHWYT